MGPTHGLQLLGFAASQLRHFRREAGFAYFACTSSIERIHGQKGFVNDTLVGVCRDEYPPNQENILLPVSPYDDLASTVIATVEDVMMTIKYFPRVSGAGPNGSRPGHLESLMKKAGGA